MFSAHFLCHHQKVTATSCDVHHVQRRIGASAGLGRHVCAMHRINMHYALNATTKDAPQHSANPVAMPSSSSQSMPDSSGATKNGFSFQKAPAEASRSKSSLASSGLGTPDSFFGWGRRQSDSEQKKRHSRRLILDNCRAESHVFGSANSKVCVSLSPHLKRPGYRVMIQVGHQAGDRFPARNQVQRAGPRGVHDILLHHEVERWHARTKHREM